MATVNLILTIIASSLKIAEKAVESMTPEQFQAFWARHEERMTFWTGLLERFKDRT